MHSTITSKGQITIPKEVRESLALEQGDRIEFIAEDDKKYSIIPVTNSLSSLKGILPKTAKKVTLEDMDEAIRKRGKE